MAPVEPLVPELLVPEDDEGDVLGVVVEVPEAPMPELVELLLEGADMELEPLTVPPAEPIPDVLPDAVPVLLQAARAATQRAVKAIFNIINSPVFGLEGMPGPQGADTNSGCLSTAWRGASAARGLMSEKSASGCRTRPSRRVAAQRAKDPSLRIIVSATKRDPRLLFGP